jgi:uncharacterized protein
VSPEILDYWSRAIQALQTAASLINRDPDASSSRAYYAAFYAVSALLAFEQRSLSKHTAIERAVHRDFVKPGIWSAELGAALSWLANLRYTADYGGGEHVQPEDAELAVEKARLILQAVRAAAPEPLSNPEPHS